MLADTTSTLPVTIVVASFESWPVNISKVSKAGFLEVMRALGIVALVFLAIILSGLEPILVCLTASFFAVVTDIMAVPEVVTPGVISVRVTPPASISKSKWTIYAIGVRTDNDHPAPALRLSIARGDESDAKQHDHTES